jgi:hypothetical protein
VLEHIIVFQNMPDMIAVRCAYTGPEFRSGAVRVLAAYSFPTTGQVEEMIDPLS